MHKQSIATYTTTNVVGNTFAYSKTQPMHVLIFRVSCRAFVTNGAMQFFFSVPFARPWKPSLHSKVLKVSADTESRDRGDPRAQCCANNHQSLPTNVRYVTAYSAMERLLHMHAPTRHLPSILPKSLMNNRCSLICLLKDI